jgi:hypothetical protein
MGITGNELLFAKETTFDTCAAFFGFTMIVGAPGGHIPASVEYLPSMSAESKTFLAPTICSISFFKSMT